MIQSMTGFGTANLEVATASSLCCDMKTLNHKFLDIIISLPKNLKQFEPAIMKKLKTSFERGRVEISLYIESDKSRKQKVCIDYEKAKAYYTQFLALKEELGISGDVDIDLLSNFRDIFVTNNVIEISDEEMLDKLNTVTDTAIEGVLKMRSDEGNAIYSDFQKRIANLKGNLSFIKEEAEKNVCLWREKITKNINALKDIVAMDNNRIEQEILLYALKSDITEECIRLENHIVQFELFLDSDTPVGKKLNFLLQEMTREVTTLLAKSLHDEILKKGMSIREEIEHLREQVYNIE